MTPIQAIALAERTRRAYQDARRLATEIKALEKVTAAHPVSVMGNNLSLARVYASDMRRALRRAAAKSARITLPEPTP